MQFFEKGHVGILAFEGLDKLHWPYSLDQMSRFVTVEKATMMPGLPTWKI